MELNVQLGRLLDVLGQTECSIDCSFVIKRISSLEEAGPQDLAIVLDRGDQSVFGALSKEKIKKCSAGLILAEKSLVDGKKYLLVKDSLVAFQKIVDFAEKQRISVEKKEEKPASFVSSEASLGEGVVLEPGCVISSRSKIGARAFIGSHVYIGRDCFIGADVKLYPGVKILDRCIIGAGSIIHAGAVIGSDGFGYQVSSQGLKKIPQIGLVRVGSEAEIGANCSIDRASFTETVIGDFVKIDNNVHIAHNVKIGAGTAILAQTGIAGSVMIGIGCQIGGQVAIKDNLRIGNGVKIVSKAGVMNDLKDGEIVAGAPAMPFKKWKRIVIIMTKLPDMFKEMREASRFLKKVQTKKSWWIRFFG